LSILHKQRDTEWTIKGNQDINFYDEEVNKPVVVSPLEIIEYLFDGLENLEKLREEQKNKNQNSDIVPRSRDHTFLILSYTKLINDKKDGVDNVKE
jgi:hypothetical protein